MHHASIFNSLLSLLDQSGTVHQVDEFLSWMKHGDTWSRKAVVVVAHVCKLLDCTNAGTSITLQFPAARSSKDAIECLVSTYRISLIILLCQAFLERSRLEPYPPAAPCDC